MDRIRLSSIVESFQGKRVAVVGDLMLDAYVWGAAKRISQEAPVPVVRVDRATSCLGGAANVARNIATLGGKPQVFGVVGDDAAGARVRGLLRGYEASDECVVTTPGRPTIEKQRIIAGNQQLLRIDREDTTPVDAAVRGQITERLLAMVESHSLDAIIFEDYDKGLLDSAMAQTVQRAAAAAGIMVSLDPHPGHPLDVRELSLITPNRREAYGLAGVYCPDLCSPVEEDESLRRVAERLAADFAPEHLLITLGSRGMMLRHRGGQVRFIATRAREVFDVSGAGDTVIAAFTLAAVGGADGTEAAELANHAAGVVVGKLGTVAVTKDELLASFAPGELT